MIVANPLAVSFAQWAAALTLDNGLSITPPLDEQAWAQWARDLRDATNAGSTLPDPVHFEDWQPWALASVLMLESF